MKSLNNWLKDKLNLEPKKITTSQDSQASTGQPQRKEERKRFGKYRGKSRSGHPEQSFPVQGRLPSGDDRRKPPPPLKKGDDRRVAPLSPSESSDDHRRQRVFISPERQRVRANKGGRGDFRESPRRSSQVIEPNKDYFRIVIIGGLNEVGRNCAVFETKNDMVMVDCGLMFPDENMFGVDYVIPDIAYVEERLHKFRGILLTHGHLDHIGGLRHVLPKLAYAPIYGSKMTIGLVKKNLEEYKQLHLAKLHEVTDKETLRLGGFQAGLIKVTHSVPGCFAIDLRNGGNRVMHTGDFKFDFTAPFPNDVPDFERLAQAGEEGVTFLMSDSTNATIDGYTRPEVTVAESLREIITKPTGRIIIGTVSSNIARIQNMIHVAKEVGRQVFIAGRSMVNNVEIAKRLQYMTWSEKHVSKLTNAANDLPDEKVLIITTGSQGEEFAALNRMANDTHMQIKVKTGDTIAFSASPIPGTGNERSITNMINKFIAKGANVITNEDLDLHSSGHGKKEDLKMMLQLVTPKYFIPVHGELFMRLAHKNLALDTGMKDEDVYLLENGSIIEIAISDSVFVNPLRQGFGGQEASADRRRTVNSRNRPPFALGASPGISEVRSMDEKEFSETHANKGGGPVRQSFSEGGGDFQRRPFVHPRPLPIRNIYIDGLGGTENEDDHVLQDRKTMSRDGVAVVLFRVSRRDHSLQGLPRIISKGFIYLDEHAELSADIAREAGKVYEKAVQQERESPRLSSPYRGESLPRTGSGVARRSSERSEEQRRDGGVLPKSAKRQSSLKSHRDLRADIRFQLGKYILKKIDREPVIVPIIVEV